MPSRRTHRLPGMYACKLVNADEVSRQCALVNEWLTCVFTARTDAQASSSSQQRSTSQRRV